MPFYPRGERGPAAGWILATLRADSFVGWYGPADEALEDALYDSQASRGFNRDRPSVAGGSFWTNVQRRIFCDRPEEPWADERHSFDEVGAMLQERGLLMREERSSMLTIIAASPSTKNKRKAAIRRCTRPGKATSGTSA